MARLVNGILGGFSGKVGTVVGVIKNEECFIRGLPRKRTHFTENELINQQKMRMIQAYLNPLKDLLKVGFHNHYTKTGGFRAALAYNRKNALVNSDTGFYIDAALLKISGGSLTPVVSPTINLTASRELIINWKITGINYLNEADQVMALVYDSLNGNAQTKIFNGAFRKDGELIIQLKPAMTNVEVAVYIGLVAADRTSQSDSQYLGKIML